jgi:hypothetical protein
MIANRIMLRLDHGCSGHIAFPVPFADQQERPVGSNFHDQAGTPESIAPRLAQSPGRAPGDRLMWLASPPHQNVEPLVCQAHPALGGPFVRADCGWNAGSRTIPQESDSDWLPGLLRLFPRVATASVGSRLLHPRNCGPDKTPDGDAAVGEVCSLSKIFNFALAPSTKSSDAMVGSSVNKKPHPTPGN